MLKTLFNAATGETAFSLAKCVGLTTLDKSIQGMTAQSHCAAPPLLETLPCRLRRFCRETEYHYGSEQTVLAERTLFPMYSACMPHIACEILSNQLYASGTGRVRCPLAPSTVRGDNRYGLRCPECEQISRADTGRDCSLTIHCIPLLTRCPVHHCPLRLHDAISAREVRNYVPSTRSRKRNSVRFGHACMTLLRPGCHGAAALVVRNALISRGYFSNYGRLILLQLTRDIASALSGGFEDYRASLWTQHFVEYPLSLAPIQNANYVAHPTAIALLMCAIATFDGGAQ